MKRPLQELVTIALPNVMNKSRFYTIRELTKELKLVTDLQNFKSTQINNTLYNVLSAGVQGGHVILDNNHGPYKQNRYQLITAFDPEYVSNFYSKNRPAEKPKEPARETRGLTQAVEYLFIAEEALKEARSIIIDLQKALT